MSLVINAIGKAANNNQVRVEIRQIPDNTVALFNPIFCCPSCTNHTDDMLAVEQDFPPVIYY